LKGKSGRTNINKWNGIFRVENKQLFSLFSLPFAGLHPAAFGCAAEVMKLLVLFDGNYRASRRAEGVN